VWAGDFSALKNPIHGLLRRTIAQPQNGLQAVGQLDKVRLSRLMRPGQLCVHQ
jgi:hypothetical protein